MRAVTPFCLAITLQLLPHWAVAEANIPPEVIAECNEAGNASDLPDCLKNGAIAVEMLNLAKTNDFYGTDATPVIDNCADRNNSFTTTWLCFKTAAVKANETRELIGEANIADPCVAAIAKVGLPEQLERIYMEKRDARFPNEMFFGGEMFYPFQGCPAPLEQAEADLSEDSHPDHQKRADDIDPARCAAYAEIENVISSRSADELRTLQASFADLEDPDAKTLADRLEITTESANQLLNADEDEGLQTAMLLGAFLRKHHPPLLQQILEDPSQISNNPTALMGDQMAMGFISMMLDAVEDTYTKSCLIE
ncbi:hypothetical protein [Sulfitobacter sp. 1A15299]|uniref:hypothetical protein n=1 Tax=Sulfitobacter sp. 1A15299 TaxID=3368598 RepID=UPI0037457C22